MWLPDDADPAVRELTEAMTLRTYELQLPHEDDVEASWPEPRAAARLGDIGVPTLVVVGAADVADIEAIARKLAAEIPGARVETIAGAGHLPSLERPDELNRLLLDFLSRGPRPRSAGHAVSAHAANSRSVSTTRATHAVGVDPQERARTAEVTERARRRERSRPVVRLRVLELEAETPVERIEATDPRQHARRGPGKATDVASASVSGATSTGARSSRARPGCVARPCRARPLRATRAARLPSRAGRRRPRRGTARTASPRARRHGRRAPRTPGSSRSAAARVARSAARPRTAARSCARADGERSSPSRAGRVVEVDDALLDCDEGRERRRELRHGGPAKDVLGGTVLGDDAVRPHDGRRGVRRLPVVDLAKGVHGRGY